MISVFPFSESGTFVTGGGLCRFLNSISRLDEESWFFWFLPSL